jgi:hypothetical protein
LHSTERAGVSSQAEPPRRALPVAAGTATELTLVVTVLLYRCTKRHPQLNRRNWQNKIHSFKLPRMKWKTERHGMERNANNK